MMQQSIQELRRNLYVKAKSKKILLFSHLYYLIYRMETLKAAYKLVNKNTRSLKDLEIFEQIENEGIEKYLQILQAELIEKTYIPPKTHQAYGSQNNSIQDRIVQAALKLILEPILEASSPASVHFNAENTPNKAIKRVMQPLVDNTKQKRTLKILSHYEILDSKLFFRGFATCVQDKEVLRLLKFILKIGDTYQLFPENPLTSLLINWFQKKAAKIHIEMNQTYLPQTTQVV